MPKCKSVMFSEIGFFGCVLDANFWCKTTKKVREGVKKLSEAELDDFLLTFKKLGPTAHRFVKQTLIQGFGINFERCYDSFVERGTTTRPLAEKRLLVVALFTLKDRIAEAIEHEYQRVLKLEKELQEIVKKNSPPKIIRCN